MINQKQKTHNIVCIKCFNTYKVKVTKQFKNCNHFVCPQCKMQSMEKHREELNKEIYIAIDHDIKLALTYVQGCAINNDDEMLGEAADKIEVYLSLRHDPNDGHDTLNIPIEEMKIKHDKRVTELLAHSNKQLEQIRDLKKEIKNG